MRGRYCSQTGTQAKKHEKPTAGARNVQAGGKYCERETRRQAGVMKLEEPGSQAGDEEGRQTG